MQVANPTIVVPTDAEPADGTSATFTFVTGHYNQTLPTGGSNSLSTTDNTFYLSGAFLEDPALYRVRVYSINNNGEAASAWSDVIGTGAPPGC